MEFLIAFLINLLVVALIVIVVFWVLGLIAAAFEMPAKIVLIVKAIIGLILLLWMLQVFFGHAPAFYALPLRTH